MLNKYILQGNLVDVPSIRGNDPEKPVVNFRIGNTSGTGEYKKTIFVTCVAFGSSAKTMKTCVEKGIIKKGSLVLVNGELRANEYEDKEGNTVKTFELELARFDGFDFCGGSKSDRNEEPVTATADPIF